LVDIRTRYGDYIKRDLVAKVNKEGIIGGITKTALQLLGDRTAVVFCVSIAHSKNVVSSLIHAGYKAAHIDGSFSMKRREQILEDLRSQKIQIISCCMVLSEGWDLPSCDAVIMARPTRSLALYIQMANRGARMSRRRPLILDHACNTISHGFSWVDRDWNLNGKVSTLLNKANTVHVCANCGYINNYSAKICGNCGCLFPKKKRTPLEQHALELAEYSKQERIRRRKRIEAFAKKKGFDSAWVQKVYTLWKV
jgi:superfamily II DNA or RNA helicase